MEIIYERYIKRNGRVKNNEATRNKRIRKRKKKYNDLEIKRK